MANSQLQKVESSMHIKASANQFHDLFSSSIHHIARICPDIIQDIKILNGEWGNEGSIFSSKYLHEGKTSTVKEVVEAVDKENTVITYNTIEGGILEYYKSFKCTLQVTPKEKGSEVHWIFEYEKQNDNIPDPHSHLLLADQLSKQVDAYLTKD